MSAPKLLCLYAAKCEKEGQFEEAARVYSKARDNDAVSTHAQTKALEYKSTARHFSGSM